MNKREAVRRRLMALRANLPSGAVRTIPYVREYHRRIRDLEDLGVEGASGFRINEGEMRFEREPKPGRYVEREFFLAQIDALILCLEPNQETRRIGFTTTEQR